MGRKRIMVEVLTYVDIIFCKKKIYIYISSVYLSEVGHVS